MSRFAQGIAAPRPPCGWYWTTPQVTCAGSIVQALAPLAESEFFAPVVISMSAAFFVDPLELRLDAEEATACFWKLQHQAIQKAITQTVEWLTHHLPAR